MSWQTRASRRQYRESRFSVNDPAAFGRVAVVFGGDSSERAVSLETGAAVLDALRAQGVDAVGWDPAERSAAELAAAGIDRAWIALHGSGGEDGRLQGLLEYLDVAYTGSGVMASALAMDKGRSKHLFRAAGIPTPEYRIVATPAEAEQAAAAMGYPLVVKPCHEGSSVGMSMLAEPGGLAAAMDLALEYDREVLIERCVEGRELTVAILQGEALPSIRIETPRTFYDYRAKYESERTTYHCPGTADTAEEADCRALALAAFAELGCSGWGRVDFMAGHGGGLEVLEVNTVPGMTSHSLVPMAAREAGMDFGSLCWRILETSMREPLAFTESRGVANGA